MNCGKCDEFFIDCRKYDHLLMIWIANVVMIKALLLYNSIYLHLVLFYLYILVELYGYCLLAIFL